MRVDKIALIAMAAAMCAALFGCAAQETVKSVSESVASSETSAEAEPTPAATPEPLKAPVFTHIDVLEPNNCGSNGYRESKYYERKQLVRDAFELTPSLDESGNPEKLYTGHTIYIRKPRVGEGDHDIRCIVSGIEVLDLSDGKDEILYMDPTQSYFYNPQLLLRTEDTCEKIYLYPTEEMLTSAKNNLALGQKILSGEWVPSKDNSIIVNGAYVPGVHFEQRDDGIYVSLKSVAYAYDCHIALEEGDRCLIVPDNYEFITIFPTVNTSNDRYQFRVMNGSINSENGTFTYDNTWELDGWTDEFPLADDDEKYVMSIEEISRILGWDFYIDESGQILNVVTDELDMMKPENMLVHEVPDEVIYGEHVIYEESETKEIDLSELD